MSFPPYCVVRYSTPALYTFELIVAAGVGLLVLASWQRGDARPLVVYVIAGLYDSAVEIAAQASGVRAIADARLFGTIPVVFPFLPFILGFFEGGVLLLTGFETHRAIVEGDTNAARRAFALTAILFALMSIGAVTTRTQLQADPSMLAITRRALFAPGQIVLLALCYGVSLAYVFSRKSGGTQARRGLALWYGCVALIAALWYTPAFAAGIRIIATASDGTYVPVDLATQVRLLYGYSIVFEAAGFYLPVFVLLHALGLIRNACNAGPSPAPPGKPGWRRRAAPRR